MDGFPPQLVRHDSSGSFTTCPCGLSLLLDTTERRFSMTSPMQLVAGVGIEPNVPLLAPAYETGDFDL